MDIYDIVKKLLKGHDVPGELISLQNANLLADILARYELVLRYDDGKAFAHPEQYLN